MLKCLMCSNCIVALHQKNRFKVLEITIRRFNRLFFWKLEFIIDSNKLESFIVVHSLIENLIDFSIDLSWKTTVLLEKSILRHYSMYNNYVAYNAIIARAQYKTSDIRFEISSTQIRKQLKYLNQMQILISNNIINISVKIVIKNYRSRNTRVNLSNNFSRTYVACRMSHINFRWCQISWHHSLVAVM